MQSIAVALMLVLAGACSSPASDDADESAAACRPEVVVEDTAVTNAFGALHGTLTLPAGCGRVPAVLIIAGSGPTDRDGNGGPALQTDTYRRLADGLSTRGIASLRYDKAGIGASRGAAPSTEAELRFEMGADDAGLLLSRLRADPRISRVVIAGHSEGALVGLLAAERTPADGYASLAGAGRPIGIVLRGQPRKQLDATMFADSDAVITQLEAGTTVDTSTLTQPLSELFRPSAQPYLISWMKYDPAREFAKLATPATIVQGTTDIQVDLVDAQLLSGARPDAELRVIDGLSHPLKSASLDASEQQRAYTDPTLPVVTEVIDAIAELATR
jgi:fermentation-respiration switch protein FrsA (DUF1100 family)